MSQKCFFKKHANIVALNIFYLISFMKINSERLARLIFITMIWRQRCLFMKSLPIITFKNI